MEHSNGKKTSTKAGTVAESLPKKGLIGGEKKFHESNRATKRRPNFEEKTSENKCTPAKRITRSTRESLTELILRESSE
jgi:hypothetical protein